MNGSPDRQMSRICYKTLSDAMALADGTPDRIWIMVRWDDGPSARVWFELDDHAFTACELEWKHGGDEAYPVFHKIEPLIVSVIENDLWALDSVSIMTSNQCLCLVTGAKTVIRLGNAYSEKEWLEASDRWVNRLNERLSGVASSDSLIDRQIDEAWA